jgi:hypothetical protein
MSHDPIDYTAIRRRVDRKIRHERIWFAHVLLFLGYMALATTGTIPISGIVLIGWAALIWVHQLWVQSIGKREAEIEREIQREYEHLEYPEKPKRDDVALTLNDDGELVEVIDEVDEPKRKRH